MDWSGQNILSVGLGTCVYLWSACTSQVGKYLVSILNIFLLIVFFKIHAWKVFPLKWFNVLFACLFKNDVCYPCLGYKTLWSCCWWRFCNFSFLVWKGMWLVCNFYSKVKKLWQRNKYFVRLSRLQDFRQFFHFGCPVFMNAITDFPVLMHGLHG